MGRKILKGLGALAALLVLGVVGLVVFVNVKGDPTFEVAPTGITASTDPEVIARGEYLFHGAMHCTACHVGAAEEALTAAPGAKLVPAGGQVWEMGPMGTLRAPNLTALQAASDEHIARVIKHGVGEDGKLRPMMSFAVASVPDDEVRALVSYVRSLPKVERAVAPDEFGPLARAMLAFGAFKPRTTAPAAYVAPSEEPSVERGKYLAHGPAMCATCHSPADMGGELHGAELSGCLEPMEGKKSKEKVQICAPNLTPHPTAGHIASWTEEAFLGRMRAGYISPETIMPWGNFAAMTDSDLKSIYRYLKTVPASDAVRPPPIQVVQN